MAIFGSAGGNALSLEGAPFVKPSPYSMNRNRGCRPLASEGRALPGFAGRDFTSGADSGVGPCH